MFNNLKNKVREKTGTDLPKLTASSVMFGKTRSNQHSRTNSQGSITSIASEHGLKYEVATNSISSSMKSTTNSQTSEEESSTRGSADWESKMNEKEREWREKEKVYVADLLKQTKELQEALTVTEDTRKKLLHCQEEKEELESYRKQEVAQIKDLLLAKEEENNANLIALKDALALVDSLKQEVSRLSPLEQQINNYQDDLEFLRHTSEKERWNLTSQLAQKEETIRHMEERISVLMHRTEADCQALGQQLSTDERVRSLVTERALLERRLEEAHIHLSEIKTSWSNQIAALETQVGRLSRQAGEEGVERRNAEKKFAELETKLEHSENEKENLRRKLDKLTKERDIIASELKQLSTDTSKKNGTDSVLELETRIELLSKENEALRQSNEESRRILDESLCKEIAKNNELNVEIAKLKEYAETLAVSIEEEKKVKGETLLRNAEISQLMQLTKQELKQQQKHNKELLEKMKTLEEQLQVSQQNVKDSECSHDSTMKDVKFEDRIKELENEISDRNKTIRILQQNLNDVKKTFQTELKNNLQANKTTTNNKNNAAIEDDINNKYMKHVLIKFLTSSEYEAQQLTKAVATLLKLSSDEERLIKETLEWRSSWFGSKPRVKPHYNPI